MDGDAFRRELFDAAWGMQRALRETMAPICQAHGVTVQQLYVMTNLARTPGATASELSERSGILRTNFTALSRKLEEAGLVERRRSEEDKRSLELYLTEEGRGLLRAVEEDARQRFDPVIEEEPAETLETISEGLGALGGLVGKLEG